MGHRAWGKAIYGGFGKLVIMKNCCLPTAHALISTNVGQFSTIKLERESKLFLVLNSGFDH